VRPSVHFGVLACSISLSRLVLNGIGTPGWRLEPAVVTVPRTS
jgi:hypothetical protein